MPYYPVLLDLAGKRVLVVGGGTVAERKIETLLESGGAVSVISKDLTPALACHVESGRIRYEGREFEEGFLMDVFLVIAATDDPLLNRQVSLSARGRGILVNVVDQPKDCTFILPATLRRGDLVIAVSTSGKIPALARKVREELEEVFGREYESLLILLGEVRKEILSRGLSSEENGKVLRRLVDSGLLPAIRHEDWEGAASILKEVTGRDWSGTDLPNMLRGT